MSELVPTTSARLPVLIAVAGDRASMRFLEFFAANIRNPHTRRAYARAANDFLTWCASAGVPSIGAVQPVHVATWIEAGTRELAAPSVKQRLAAIRHLFDWLVTGQSSRSTRRHRCAGPGTSSRPGKRRCSIRPKREHYSTASTRLHMPACAIAR
jgi:hypothetical protein